MCVLYHSNSHSLAEMDWINMGPTLYVSRFSCILLKMTSMQRFINIEQKLKKLAHQTRFGGGRVVGVVGVVRILPPTLCPSRLSL